MVVDVNMSLGCRTQQEFDAIIVGGGIIGAAIFHRLAQSGRQVLLIEKSRFAQGATGWSSALLNCYEASETLTALACAALPKFLDMGRQGGPKLQRCGCLHFIYPGQESVTQERIQEMRHLASVEWLNAVQGAHLFPGIHWNDLAGAVFEPSAGYMDPVAVNRFWIQGGRAMGQLALEGVEFRGVAQGHKGVCGIYSSAGLLRSQRVILSAGAWTRKLAGTSGLALPCNVFPRSLQSNVFATTQFVGEHPAYVDPELGLYGRGDGQTMMQAGAPVPDWNIDPDKCSEHSLQQQVTTRDLARRRFAWSEHAQPAGGWRRFDAFTSDGEGVVTADGHIPGVYWATGFSGHGFKIAPSVAAQVEALAFALGQHD
jgi:glycine/D-amino acid oxidase-like deaminating enzyme